MFCMNVDMQKVHVGSYISHSVSGQTKNLNLTVVMASSTLAILKWNKFEMDDSREMLGYVIYYREV